MSASITFRNPILSLLIFIIMIQSMDAVIAQTTPQQSSPGQLVDALHSAFGKHPARAVHAKGIILEGTFTPAVEAASITTAVHFKNGKLPVVVRFSDFTGIPDISDANGLANPRGFAIKFKLPDGSSTDIVGHSFNGFPTATSDEFRELLLAIGASGADAAKPTALDNFLGGHPIAKTFLTTQNPAPLSYATTSYFGVNAFKFTNEKGESHFIRYQFITEEEHYLTADETAKADPDYLQKEIPLRVAQHSFKFKMYAQVAEAGDKIDNPSIAWPASRKLVFLGTVEIQKMASNSVAEDKALSFIPNNIPAGIAPADPMINFRSQAYPISVKERQ
ncbi:catalase family peroxidase [soil metagenome]